MKQIPKVINQPKPTIHVKAWFIQSAKLRKSNTFAYFSILKLAYTMALKEASLQRITTLI